MAHQLCMKGLSFMKAFQMIKFPLPVTELKDSWNGGAGKKHHKGLSKGRRKKSNWRKSYDSQKRFGQ